MLLKRHEALNDARIKLKQALENPYLKAGKIITAGVAGIIFFSGGFFAGQTVSLAIASLFVATMTATAWPIVAASLVVGLAAFSVYWYVERPGIENLISRWKGFDKEKMDKFCKTKVVDRETEKLQNLIAGIEEKLSLHSLNATAQSHINHLEVEVSSLRKQLTEKTKFDALPQVAHANNDEILNDFINGNESNSVKEVASSPHVQCSLFKSNDQKSRVDIRSQESLYTQGASF